MNQQIVLGMIRHVLTTLGGVLVSKGYTDPTGLEAIVGGLCVVIGIAWSAMNKKKTTPEA